MAKFRAKRQLKRKFFGNRHTGNAPTVGHADADVSASAAKLLNLDDNSDVQRIDSGNFWLEPRNLDWNPTQNSSDCFGETESYLWTPHAPSLVAASRGLLAALAPGRE
ncbi:hypothetical protein HPB50_024386 [Hyalomma asiaticum]|uniref:Uncharacterized protein n=1 Tax=Hyalomma asiaticum TaxID=266040 RepID=A0ACB7S9J0_HYAAI|nr:hypothetical protein HPB50_024386 [Hyalomma asiaticum]